MSYEDDAIVYFAELQLVVGTKPVIIRPVANELWIAGEKDTIRWNADGIDSVDLLFSTNYQDDAGAFEEIVHGYPADSGRYVWQIPDTILSRKCAIEIEATATPNTFAISDSFKIKPYVLTRDENGNYVPYRIGPYRGRRLDFRTIPN